MGYTKDIPRGFSGIGLISPKTGANVGGVLRAAYCHGASFVVIQDIRTGSLKAKANVCKTERTTPTYFTDDVLRHVPHNTEIVVVELVKTAIPLPEFKHPERAFYVFGPEDGSVPPSVISKAHKKVFIPTRNCMNLACCATLIMYDRQVKLERKNIHQGRFGDTYA